MFRPVHRPICRSIQSSLLTRPGGSYASIVGETGELAPYVTFTRSSTATRYNSAGLLETVAANAPRYDYDPATLQLRGLLIEEQRTNIQPRSQEFNNSTWIKFGATVIQNAETAPDGSLTAHKLVEDSATGLHYAYALHTLTANTTYSMSVYAKAGERSRFQLAGATPAWGSSITATFDLSTGQVVQSSWTSASIVAVGGGWYRCTVIGQSAASPVSSQAFQIPLIASGTSQSYAGDGTSGIYLWGAQLEAGAFATSYIPTTTAAVTRAADAATISDLSSVGYNAVEGSFFAQGSFNQVGNATRIINVFDGSYANQIYFIRSSLSIYSLSSGSGGTQDGSAFAGTSSASLFKLAGAYKVNDYAASLNGGSVGTDSSVQVPIGLNQAIIGSTRPNTEVINGHIRRLRYYPRRLTNAQLQALTA